MKTLVQKTLYLSSFVFVMACGGGKDDPDPDPVPQAVQLLAPPNNSFCVGNDLGDTIQVLFEWSSASFANHYTVTVYNTAGTVIISQFSPTTSLQLNLPKSTALTWNVKAINDFGESISSTFGTTTPGDAIPNFIPAIKSINFHEAQNKIVVVVQDREGDPLFFDAQSADNDAFENPTNYAENQEVAASSANQDEQTVTLENIIWSSDFWFKFTLRDATGNQIRAQKSQKFN